jgi:uncharacterized protein
MKNMKKKMNGGLIALVMCILFSTSIWGQLNDGRNDDPKSKWLKEVISKRQEKDLEFKTSATSPMAGFQRMEIRRRSGQVLYISEEQGKLTLPVEKISSTIFILKEKSGNYTWEPVNKRIVCRDGNKTLNPGSQVVSGSLFQGGALNTKVYIAKDKLVLVVFNPQLPQKLRFENLLYYPPSKQYAVPATMEKFPKAKAFEVSTSRNLKKTYFRYAKINFQLDGKKLQLIAFKFALSGEYSDVLFIPYGDTTNGAGSYEVGRFLEFHEPKTSSFTLDFNDSYNPLCNYSEVYNCPIPPRENILDVAIKAGEREYPHLKQQEKSPRRDDIEKK